MRGQRRNGASRHDHEPRIHGADEGDEQADADTDGPAQVERDRVHHAFPDTKDHEREHDEPFDDNQPHRGLPRPRRRRELKRDDGVQPHARGERDGSIGDDAHQQATESRRRGGRSRGTFERHTGRRQDGRIRKEDVRHREERGEGAPHFAGDRGVASCEIEHDYGLGLWTMVYGLRSTDYGLHVGCPESNGIDSST